MNHEEITNLAREVVARNGLALQRVLELHRPIERQITKGKPFCAACSHINQAIYEDYPCRTIVEIEEVLI